MVTPIIPPTRVLLLGFGAIGRHVARLLRPEVDAGTVTLGASVRDVAAHRHRGSLGVDLFAADDQAWAEALDGADLVVECAGVRPATERGPQAIAAGYDLVLTSVGALADDGTARRLLAGPGRLWVTNGAIGGFDVLAAAAEAGGLDTVRIRTAKLAASLVRPWMEEGEAGRLRALAPGDEAVTVFDGGPAVAIERFPANVNVAVALAWATRGLAGPSASDAALLAQSLARVQVELVADPDAELSRHEINASGPAGRFSMAFESSPSPENPKTSGLTALSVARTVRQALRR